MIRRRGEKRAHRALAEGRLANARDFLKSARDLLALADEDANGNPAMSQAVQAAIAYADALTIRAGGVRNTGDHAAAVELLRDVLGRQADDAQLQRLGRILALKDATQYGYRSRTIQEAARLVAQMERLAEWAEALLVRL